MIGVIANPSEHAVVREFFELFKTPWEFYRDEQGYEVLLCAGDVEVPEDGAQLVLIYSGQEARSDSQRKVQIESRGRNSDRFSYRGTRLPIYGDSVTFPKEATAALVDEESRQPALHLHPSRMGIVVRIGYDLFGEIRTLLTSGQPIANASIPTLELHIALLRDLIVENGIPLVEIPPVPEGYRCIACLTHDVDHPSIRRHKIDHTMVGFLYRAVFGSLFDVLRGRATLLKLLTNWAAALKLPFIYLGQAKDFWLGFDRYTNLEGGAGSTFFVIPFEGRPGQKGSGQAPSLRASGYGAADLASQIRRLVSAGCEVGLHGIDAWRDSSKGHEELEEIRQITGTQEIGVRMHWLYFDEQSPVTLERAGADYDSTIGYNETVGYRSGTTQVYKPLQTTRLLELPLHVMDTALFFPGYLDCSSAQAKVEVGKIIDNAIQFGGCVTVNWHDRSIAPERLWGDFYVDLVKELRNKGAWFPTATQTVSWFRNRRSAVFETVDSESGAPRVRIASAMGNELPGLQLRVHNGNGTHVLGAVAADGVRDLTRKQSVHTSVALS